MSDVELIYDRDCPNVEAARERLRSALMQAGFEAQWQEWERSDPQSPDYVKRYGSPTILVAGKDAGGASPGDGKSCRVYADGSGRFSGVPSPEAIVSALFKTKKRPERSQRRVTSHTRGYRRILAALPALGAVLIPGVSCPACWPAYAGLLSSLGVGFVNYTPYLLPLTLLCLAVAVFSLGFRARRRHGFGPLCLGVVAALVVTMGKFLFTSKAAIYGGLVLLVGASIWNSWPRRVASGASCPDCVPAGTSRAEMEHR